MEIKLLPGISLLPETLSALIVPEKMLGRVPNSTHLQQLRICIAQPMKQATDGITLYAITLDRLGSNI